jgi:hypothetical protein
VSLEELDLPKFSELTLDVHLTDSFGASLSMPCVDSFEYLMSGKFIEPFALFTMQNISFPALSWKGEQKNWMS